MACVLAQAFRERSIIINDIVISDLIKYIVHNVPRSLTLN